MTDTITDLERAKQNEIRASGKLLDKEPSWRVGPKGAAFIAADIVERVNFVVAAIGTLAVYLSLLGVAGTADFRTAIGLSIVLLVLGVGASFAYLHIKFPLGDLTNIPWNVPIILRNRASQRASFPLSRAWLPRGILIIMNLIGAILVLRASG